MSDSACDGIQSHTTVRNLDLPEAYIYRLSSTPSYGATRRSLAVRSSPRVDLIFQKLAFMTTQFRHLKTQGWVRRSSCNFDSSVETSDPFIGRGSQEDRTRRWFWGLPNDQWVEVCLQRMVGLRPGTKWILGPHDDQLPEWEMRRERTQCRIAPVYKWEIDTGYIEAWRHIERGVFTVPGIHILRRLANEA
jgi:hypothetical protein